MTPHLLYGIIIVGTIGDALHVAREMALQSYHVTARLSNRLMQLLGKGMTCIDDASNLVTVAKHLDGFTIHLAVESYAVVHLHRLLIAFGGIIERVTCLFANLHCHTPFCGSTEYQYHGD